MVSTVGDPGSRHGCLVLQPNATLSWQGAVVVFIVFNAPSLAVAITCGLLGCWYVLPASLFVIACVGLGLWSGYRRSQQRQVVSIEDESVAVEKGHNHPESRFEFQRGWTQIVLEPPARSRRLSRLLLRSQGREVELGEFLDESERRDLAHRLSLLLGTARSLGEAGA